MKVLSVEVFSELIDRHGFNQYANDLITQLKEDFVRRDEFILTPRPSIEVPGGVIELMPIRDIKYHAYKYVTCYPQNPPTHQTVVAIGQLSSVETGYPIMISEMTLMTAFRTAATTALATKFMARQSSQVLALIGTGAQSEFQARFMSLVRDIKEIRYFDTDVKAMDKFAHNMNSSSLKLVRCRDAKEAVEGADIITTCTACKGHVDVVKSDWIKPGVHINSLGGDCPGKTELELSILPRTRLVTDYLGQAVTEGEIQRLSSVEVKKMVHGELHELVSGIKKGRKADEEITLFDSVGMAMEDYSAIRLTYNLAEKYGLGKDLNLLPDIIDPKNLISILEK